MIKAHLRLFGVRGRRRNSFIAKHHVAHGKHHSQHHNRSSNQVSQYARRLNLHYHCSCQLHNKIIIIITNQSITENPHPILDKIKRDKPTFNYTQY